VRPARHDGDRREAAGHELMQHYVAVGDPRVEAKWEAIEAAMTAAIGDASGITVRIPGWEPTDLSTGFFWLRSNVYEGFNVDFLLDEDETGHEVLWLKSWEYWDPDAPTDQEEPTWETIKATPISPSQDWS
jgi:hypothetical protein